MPPGVKGFQKGNHLGHVHGECSRSGRSPAYTSWDCMIQRCTNPNKARYPDYGGRGIKVCARWFSFQNFLADMGPRPDGMTLDRKENNGNYTPNNCRWATADEQYANQRR